MVVGSLVATSPDGSPPGRRCNSEKPAPGGCNWRTRGPRPWARPAPSRTCSRSATKLCCRCNKVSSHGGDAPEGPRGSGVPISRRAPEDRPDLAHRGRPPACAKPVPAAGVAWLNRRSSVPTTSCGAASRRPGGGHPGVARLLAQPGQGWGSQVTHAGLDPPMSWVNTVSTVPVASFRASMPFRRDLAGVVTGVAIARGRAGLHRGEAAMPRYCWYCLP